MRSAAALLLLLPALLALTAGPTRAQGTTLIVGNRATWASGTEIVGQSERSRRYFEERLSLDLYRGAFRIGGRLELLQPSEFGEEQTGIRALDKRYLEYGGEGFRLRAGDFYTVWGRGLTLALIEDLSQGFDTGLDGLLASFQRGPLSGELLAGRSEAGFLGAVRESQLAGGRLLAELPLQLTVGVNALRTDPPQGQPGYGGTRTLGGTLEWFRGAGSFFAEYAHETGGGELDRDALYLSASGVHGPFGLVLEYKRYRYPLHPGGLSEAGQLYAQTVETLPFHSPPVVQREFTSTLLGRHPHIVRFQDETGWQAELTWSPGPGTSLTATASQSSSFDREDLWWPSLREENSPFRELFVRLDHHAGRLQLGSWLGANEDLVYVIEERVRARASWHRRGVAGAEAEWRLDRDWTLLADGEGGIFRDMSRERTHGEWLAGLGAAWRGTVSLTVTGEWSELPDEQSGKSHWLKAEGRLQIGRRHELLVMVGEERGGLVCSSGRCRLVTPFEGVRLTLTSQL